MLKCLFILVLITVASNCEQNEENLIILKTNEALKSPDKNYNVRIVNCNLIVSSRNGNLIWQTNTFNKSKICSLALSDKGNLKLVSNDEVVWETKTENTDFPFTVEMIDDGNLTVLNKKKENIWKSPQNKNLSHKKFKKILNQKNEEEKEEKNEVLLHLTKEDDDKYYINLRKTGDNDNYSTNSGIKVRNLNSDNQIEKKVWSKLAFDPETMLIDTYNVKFSSEKEEVYFKNNNKVKNQSDNQMQRQHNSYFSTKIDLRGTNLAVDYDWLEENTLKGDYQVRELGQILELSNDGICERKKINENTENKNNRYIKLKMFNKETQLNPYISYECGGKTYLILQKIDTNFTQKTYNYSMNKIPQRKPWGSSDTDVITIWTKVNIDLNTLILNTSDYKYSQSIGYCGHYPFNPNKVPYGSAFGCESPSNADATANIDLTGTNFAIDDSWRFDGAAPAGKFTFANNNQIVSLVGGGYCGWIAPTKANGNETTAVNGGNFIQLKII